LDRSLSETDPACLNCGSPAVDEFCARCGQPYRGGERLTIRGLLAEFGHKFLNLERGLLRTARDLTVRPGAMMRDYVTGKRKTYVNPFTYLVFGTAINLVVYRLTGTREKALLAMRGQFAQDPNMGAEMARSMAGQMELLVDHNLYLMLVMAIPFALLLRLFFWRFGATLAELAVLPLYTFGHVALLGTLGSLALVGQPYPMKTMGAITFAVYVFYTAFAAWGFFGRGLWPAVKTSMALLASYVVTIGLATVLIVVSVLATSGSRLDHLTSRSWTLPDAVEQGVVHVARDLLEDGADPNRVRGLTPLHLAVGDGSLEMTELLLSHGADPDATDLHDRTPLVVALEQRHSRIARRLVAAGTDLSLARDDGTTALMLATADHDHELMREMIERGAPLDAFRPDKRAATALLQAVTGDDLEALDILLAAGADPTVTDHKGRSALDLAETDEIRQRLRKALE
jgi:hypothetical protein